MQAFCNLLLFLDNKSLHHYKMPLLHIILVLGRLVKNFLLCQGFQFPDITGGGLNSEATYTADGVYKGSGCVKATNDGGSNPNRNLPAGSQYAWCWWGIDASWSNIKYGASATVQPIAFQVLMIVKA